MEFWDKKLGLGIKLRRKEMNIRQVDLAERLHVEPTTISRWETGSGSPDISILPNLAYELGTSVDDLLGNKKRNKEDEIKKEKIDINAFMDVLIKTILVFILFIILFFSYVYIIHFFSSKVIVINAYLKFIVCCFCTLVSIFFICSNKLKKYFITLNYKMKFKHKYPIGYKFEINQSYLNFINIIIFIVVLVFDALLILG